MEKILQEKCVYDGKILSVYNNTVETPVGVAYRDIVKHNGGVSVLPIDDELNIYLVRQYRSGAGESLIEIPAGKLELSEGIFECARRELSEETGFSAKEYYSLGYIYPTPAYDTEKIYIYIAKGLSEGKVHLDEGEFVDVIKVSYNDAVDMINNGEITDAKTVVAILRAGKMVNK